MFVTCGKNTCSPTVIVASLFGSMRLVFLSLHTPHFPTCCFHFVSMLFCVILCPKDWQYSDGNLKHTDFFFLFKEKRTFLYNALTAWLANSDISNFSTSRSNTELPNIGYFVFLFEETYKTGCLIHKRWVNLPWIFDIHDPYSYR